MIKYIRSFSFEIKKNSFIVILWYLSVTEMFIKKIARNDKFYLIYITSVSLVLMIINELSLFGRNTKPPLQKKSWRSPFQCKTMQISFKLVSSSVSQIKKIKLRNRVISRFLACYLITNNVKRTACKFTGCKLLERRRTSLQSNKILTDWLIFLYYQVISPELFLIFLKIYIFRAL